MSLLDCVVGPVGIGSQRLQAAAAAAETPQGGLQATFHTLGRRGWQQKPCSQTETTDTTCEKRDVFSQRYLQPSEHPGVQEEDEEETLRAAEGGGFPSQWPRAERADVGSQSFGGYVSCSMSQMCVKRWSECECDVIIYLSADHHRLMTWARCLYLSCCFRTTSKPAPR